MKKTVLLLMFALVGYFTFAQVPEYLNYQAVVRDEANNPLTNQNVSFKISILKGSITGTLEYRELHNTTTNSLGLVNLVLGGGIDKTGELSSIDWGADKYFLKVELDPAGGTNYTEMGITQLLSVPYALYAKTAGHITDNSSNIPVLTTSEIIELSPVSGDAVYNTSTGNFQIYDGNSWIAIPGLCWPQPTAANAGSDQIFTDGLTTNTTLAANTPEINYGTGQWSIINGEGGSFTDASDPNTTFSGQECTQYDLIWEITTDCSVSRDSMVVEFTHIPTVADAGADQVVDDEIITTVILDANSPEPDYGTGQWSVINGEGGSFDDVNDPKTTFTGQHCTTYDLKWEISTNCLLSSDTVNIKFYNTASQAFVYNPEKYFSSGITSTTISADPPDANHGTGQWSIVSGEGGSIEDPSESYTTFTGQLYHRYEIVWSISTACETTTDTSIIVFGKIGPGNDVNDADGNTYNTVWIGTQLWMAENLKTSKYSDGTDIPLVSDDTEWCNLTTPAYCWYKNDPTYADPYGALYNFKAVETENICPTGWHIPTDAEWLILIEYLGGEDEAGGKLKEAGTEHWDAPNEGATNSSGFTALPGGARYDFQGFDDITRYGFWWSAIENGIDYSKIHLLYYDFEGILKWDAEYWAYGFSVRCVRTGIDGDNDGFTVEEGDCDDSNAAVFPGNTEICGDGIDQDCDGSDLECGPEDIDDDGDGFTENQGDCDDSDDTIYPSATEICSDGIDQDCDGSDLLCPEDIDDDSDGFTENQGDCDDSDDTVYPGAAEICGDGIDQNCDGSDSSLCDMDGDGVYDDTDNCPSVSNPDQIDNDNDGIGDACDISVAGEDIIDIDNNTYNTVTIGTQTWMGKNLRTTKYNDGTDIPLVTGNTEWNNLTTPGYCWYNNNEAAYGDPYGAFYNWYAVNTSMLCPTGWHVPSDTEWNILKAYLGGYSVAGGLLKEEGTSHWYSPNVGATNESGFTALPAGYRWNVFSSLGYETYIWCSNLTSEDMPIMFYLNTEDSWAYAGDEGNTRSCGFSVRCLKDE